MDVSIYIDVYHTGRLKGGNGTYGMVLEYMTKHGAATKTYLRGIKGATQNRTALLSCIAGFKELNRECNVKIIINTNYITAPINTGTWFQWMNTGKNAKGKPVVNLDLWKQLFELVDKHNTEFIYSEKSSYTGWIQGELKKETIKYFKEDEINV